MNQLYLKAITKNLQLEDDPKENPSLQVLSDQTKCEPFIRALIAGVANSVPTSLVYDVSSFKLKRPKAVSSSYASRWLAHHIKKHGYVLNTFILYCPAGTHVPVQFVRNLLDGKLVNGQRIHPVRVTNIVVIHNGFSDFRQLKPVATHTWVGGRGVMVVPKADLDAVVYGPTII